MNVEPPIQARTLQSSWNPAKGRVLELLGVSDGVAELAVSVEATGEEIVEQAGTHLLELCNHRLCLSNRLIHRLQDSSNPLALFGPWPRNCKTPHLLIVESLSVATCIEAVNLRLSYMRSEDTRKKDRILMGRSRKPYSADVLVNIRKVQSCEARSSIARWTLQLYSAAHHVGRFRFEPFAGECSSR